MTNIYANVGKTGNLAQSLLLIHAKLGRFCRFLHPLENVNSLEHNPLPEFARPKKSAEICRSLHSEQIFAAEHLHFTLRVLHIPRVLGFLPGPCAHFSSSCILHLASCIAPSSPFVFFVVKSPAHVTRVTGKTRTDQPHINCTKSIVFAKKPLPDYSITNARTDYYRNRQSSFLRTFSQICQESRYSLRAERDHRNHRRDNHPSHTTKTHEMGDGNAKPTTTLVSQENSPKTVAICGEKAVESPIIFRTRARGKPTRGDEK